jgi:hypothetical protein
VRAELQLDLEDTLRRIVEDVVSRLASQPTRWLDVDGAAAYLSLGPAAVRSKVQRDELPAHRLPGSGGGRSLRFDVEELDALIRAGAAP